MNTKANIARYRRAFKKLTRGEFVRDGADYAGKGLNADGHWVAARISGTTGLPLMHHVAGDRDADLNAALGL